MGNLNLKSPIYLSSNGFIKYSFENGENYQNKYEENDENTVVKSGTYKTKTNVQMYYETYGIIGEGAFGVVFNARNQNNEFIAIKQKKYLSDRALMQKSTLLFRCELEALYNLEHSNIVRLLGVEFKNDDVQSIIMENINGVSLEKYIVQRKHLKQNKIQMFLIQLVDAIAYMHSRCVMHRDIKSSNIMIVKGKSIKIIDFGTAKLLYMDGRSRTPVKSTCVGTAPYMAPECIDFKNYDTKADIYSIGALLFEMATGDVYINFNLDGSNKNLVMLAQFRGQLTCENLSTTGNDFLNRCLLKNPMQRPSAYELKFHDFINMSKA